MELAFQLTHNSRLSIGYQTVTDAHKNKGLKGSKSLMKCVSLNCQNHNSSSSCSDVMNDVKQTNIISFELNSFISQT